MAGEAIPDIMFDEDPIELAEEWAELDGSLEAVLETDEEAAAGDVIYFGLSTPVGEIAEVKAEVKSCTEIEDDVYHLTVAVLAVDKALEALAVKTLQTGGSEEADAGQPMWALGLKQQNQTYAVLANVPAGVLNAAQLQKISELSAEGAGIVKLTHAQRVILLVGADQIESTKEGLESVDLRVGVLHHGIRNVRACCGALCRFAQGIDAISLAQAIDEKLFGRKTKFDIKIAVSDCTRNCSESFCADIGLVGQKDVYDVVVGGRGSKVPFRAMVLQKGLKQADVPEAVSAVVDWYESNAEEGERLWQTMERLGKSAAESLDTGALGATLESMGDGIDELARIQSHVARLAGTKTMRGALAFCS